MERLSLQQNIIADIPFIELSRNLFLNIRILNLKFIFATGNGIEDAAIWPLQNQISMKLEVYSKSLIDKLLVVLILITSVKNDNQLILN